MEKEIIYKAIPVEERLPKHTKTCSVLIDGFMYIQHRIFDIQRGLFLLQGKEKVTHWLERQENASLQSPEVEALRFAEWLKNKYFIDNENVSWYEAINSNRKFYTTSQLFAKFKAEG
jgi:hypothetical protein